MSASMRTPIVVILGATGTGKTKLSLELARLFNGEIISADSMQIYKGLDIITNKATVEEQSVCAHHMIDYLPPHRTNTILEYKAAALPTIDSIIDRGKVPIVVGGTIYYIGALLWNSTVIDKQDIQLAKTLVEGLEGLSTDQSSGGSGELGEAKAQANVPRHQQKDTSAVVSEADGADKLEDTAEATVEDEAEDRCNSSDDQKASRLEPDTESSGEEDGESPVERSRYRGMTTPDLYRRLAQVDQATADRLHPHNRRKIIRALEVYDRYGVPMSEVYRAQQTETGDHEPSGSLRYQDTCVFWLQSDMDVLDARLDGRVDSMIEQGLLKELTDFHSQYNKLRLNDNMEADYTTGIFQSIGFKEFHEYLMLPEDERQTDMGKQMFEKGVVDLKQATRKYARYQIKRLRRLFFGAAVSQTTRVPVYGLDCTDVSKWDEVVSKPAVEILSALIKGDTPPVAPMEPTRETIQFERNECKLCGTVCVTQHEWQKHNKSKHHKHNARKHREELRKLTQTLDEVISQKKGFSRGGEESQASPIAASSSSPTSSTEVVDQEPSNSSSSAEEEQPRKRVNAGHKVGFEPEWQKDRPWLQVKVEVGEEGERITSMICSLCQEFNTSSNRNRTWVDSGCKTLRLDKVKGHEKSDPHKTALALSLSKKLPNIAANISSAAKDSITDALKVLRFLTKKNLPLDLFKDLIDLCIDTRSESLANLRLVKNATYSSWDIIDDLLTILSDEVKTTVTEEVQRSPSFSTMVDEVCDKRTEKHLAICVRYVSTEGAVKTSFLSDTAIPEANAENLTRKIVGELERHNLLIQNMTGFTSDGAAVFLGKKTGVGKRLKDLNPHMVTTHCMDHRLALACRDSYASVPGMKKLDETLEHLHKYYKYSAKNAASLKEVQKAFSEAPLAIKQAKHHRWLSHENAVASIVRSYKSLVANLESNTIGSDPVGNGLLKSLRDPDCLRLLLLLADILPHVTGLSLFFQRKNINLGMVKSMVDKTLRTVQTRETSDGPWLQKAEKLMADCGIAVEQPSAKFSSTRRDFLQALRANIEGRFEDTDVIENLSVLELQDQEFIPTFYGDVEMEALAEYFGMESETLTCQWQGFLELIKLSEAPRTMSNILQLFYGENHADKGFLAQFPLVGRMFAAASVLPLSTAEVERVFSQLKLIKTDHRCENTEGRTTPEC